jgi:hypothetical protein
MTLPSGLPPVTHLPPTTDTNYYDNVLKEMLDAKKNSRSGRFFFCLTGEQLRITDKKAESVSLEKLKLYDQQLRKEIHLSKEDQNRFAEIYQIQTDALQGKNYLTQSQMEDRKIVVRCDMSGIRQKEKDQSFFKKILRQHFHEICAFAREEFYKKITQENIEQLSSFKANILTSQAREAGKAELQQKVYADLNHFLSRFEKHLHVIFINRVEELNLRLDNFALLKETFKNICCLAVNSFEESVKIETEKKNLKVSDYMKTIIDLIVDFYGDVLTENEFTSLENLPEVNYELRRNHFEKVVLKPLIQNNQELSFF